mmetsp:Transcript_10483/g.16063  ORF Transcript_10483/g.16063 Transcript_10483/m.16063 type:complete len:132 (+) Transcript_10483:288-683(+)
MTERLKYKHKGKTRELSAEEKRVIVAREMQNLRFDEKAFYDNNPEWFAFESRLRDMMLGIMEPVIKKTLQDSNYVNKVIFHQEYQKTKVDELDFSVQKLVRHQCDQDEFQLKLKEYDLRTHKKEQELDVKL